MSRSLTLVGASVLASASIAFAAAPAFAATTAAPAPGTPECTTAVNDTTVVQTDRTDLTQTQAVVRNDRATYDAAVAKLTAQQNVVAQLKAALGTTLTDPIGGVTGVVNQAEVDQAAAAVPALQTAVDNAQATLTADQAKVATARNDLAAAIQNQTNLLCTGTGAPVVTPTPAPAPGVLTSGALRPLVSEANIDGAVDDLTCASSNTELQRIDRAIADRQAAHQTTLEVNARLNAKLASLNCTGASAVTPQAAAQTAQACGCAGVVTATTPATGTVVRYGAITSTVTPETVSPTASDNSTANLSGSEVTTAPVGSASTGAV